MHWCERCGAGLGPTEQGLPCLYCWEAKADDALIAELVGQAEDALSGARDALSGLADPGARDSFARAMLADDPTSQEAGRLAAGHEARARTALQLLAQIDDRQGAPALRRLAGEHSEPRIRAAALRSLAWSGDGGDVPLAVQALDARDDRERAAAIAALAELGGTVAADALAARLDVAVGEELEQLVAALAWLRDPRALEQARLLAPAALEGYNADRRNSVWALVRLGDEADHGLLRERLAGMGDDPSSQYQALGQVANALAAEDPAATSDVHGWAGLTHPSAAQAQMQTREPLAPRTVPRLALTELLLEPVSHDAPQAKFGGQPDWIDTPAWPHTSDGRPLIFYGQLPLLGQPRRVAYIFIGFDASWEPLGEGNAVVVQPGPVPSHIGCRIRATGPALYEDAPQPARFRGLTRMHRPYERFVRLAEGADPERWEWPEMPPGVYGRDEHGDWNKIGGTGLWLQGEPHLPGDGWRFAFQFTAGWAGRELGDGAECYGFVREDGSAALAWDCH